MVERIGERGIRNEIWIRLSVYTRKEKYGEGYRRKIQEISDKNTVKYRNRYPGGSQYRGRFKSDKVTKERLHDRKT